MPIRSFARRALSWVFVLAGVAASGAEANSRPTRLPDCDSRAAPLYDHGRFERRTPLGNEGYFPPTVSEARTHCAKEWTILVFMAADNDLEPHALQDLDEMEAGYSSGRIAAGSTERTDLLVEFDGRDDQGSRRLHIQQRPEPLRSGLAADDFSNRSVAEVRSPIVGRVAEGAGTPSTRLRDFLAWGLERFPSKHVLVILWGHGQGYTSASPATPDGRGAFTGRGFGGLAFDASERGGGYLSTPQLRWALRRASLDANDGKPFDLYASDACLMQMAEVATEISDAADWIVGSAQTQVYQGLPYRRLLFELNTGRLGKGVLTGLSDSVDPARRVAELIPPLLKASLAAGGSQSGSSRAADELSISSISSSELNFRLLPALEELAEALTVWIERDAGKSLSRRLAVANAARSAVTFPGAARDLGSLLSRLEEVVRAEENLLGPLASPRREIAAAREALLMTVVSGARGANYTSTIEKRYLDSPGSFSVWFPADPRQRNERLADLSRSSFFRSLPAWRTLLTVLYGP